jgi:hydroxymethylpyrimidine/phosphomethylpyrimidine kinase
LVPLADVVTPNLPEAARLVHGTVERRSDMIDAGRELVALGCRAALVTGGHLRDGSGAPDCLVLQAQHEVVWLEGDRVPGREPHGTGCVLSAAIAANLALGHDVETSCRRGKAFVTNAITASVSLGRGRGSANPGWGRPAGE